MNKQEFNQYLIRKFAQHYDDNLRGSMENSGQETDAKMDAGKRTEKIMYCFNERGEIVYLQGSRICIQDSLSRELGPVQTVEVEVVLPEPTPEQIRNSALEEAAELCASHALDDSGDDFGACQGCGEELAQAIRALKRE